MRTRMKEWFGRLMLLAGTLLVTLCVLEVALRVLGYADPAVRWDPMYGFSSVKPVYVAEHRDGREVMVPAANRPETTRQFNREKLAGAVRVFALGGSTTWGGPWGSEWAYPRWLEDDISERLGVPAEVINVGRSGDGSARVLEVLRQVVDYDPDLLVVYTGQNEFRDAQFHLEELVRPRLWHRGLELLLSSRLGYGLYVGWLKWRERSNGPRIISYATDVIEATVSAPFSDESFRSYERYLVPELEPRRQSTSPVGATVAGEGAGGSGLKGGVKRLLGERRWAELKWAAGRRPEEIDVYSEFQSNLEEMIRLSNEAGVPIVFLPLSWNRKARDLTRLPTLKADFIRDGMEESWRSHYEQAVGSLRDGRCEDAIPHLESVADTYMEESRNWDPNLNRAYAECLEALSMRDRALAEYNKNGARPDSMRRIVRSVARDYEVPILDVDSLFLDYTFPTVPGYDLFVDMIHPHIAGHRLVGCELAEFAARESLIERANVEDPALPSCRARADEWVEVADSTLSAGSLTSLGFSLFNRGEFEEARRVGELALSRGRSLPEIRRLQTYLLLGRVYSRLGNREAAYSQWLTLKESWDEVVASGGYDELTRVGT